MSTTTDEAALGHLIADVARLYQKAYERFASRAHLDLTAAEARVLSYVTRFPGLKQSSLAARMCVEPMTLSIYVDRLARRELVERVPDPADRRVRILQPGPTAHAALRATREVSAALHECASEGLREPELAALARGLEALRGCLSQSLGHAADAEQQEAKPEQDSPLMPATAMAESLRDLALAASTRDVPDGIIWRAAADGSVIEATHWDSYTGQSMAEARGYGWISMVHPEDRTHTLTQWQSCVRGANSYDTVVRVRHVSGAFRWLRAQGTLRQGDHSSASEWVGMLVDVEREQVSPQTKPDRREAATA